MADVVNNQELIPDEIYSEQYEKTDPVEVSARTGVPYDPVKHVFTYTLMNSVYEIGHPEFSVRYISGAGDFLSDRKIRQLLVMRYLISGHFVRGSGRFVAYREMPWGEVYNANFEGRCIKRLAYTFAGKGSEVAKKMPLLGGIPYEKGDFGWEFEFMPGLTIRFAVWNADDEFPPSSQILFSDNFQYAFSAEDLAYVGDIFIMVVKSV